MAPATLDALLLLGWMEPDQAIALLTEHCWFDPPLDRRQAEGLFSQHRDRVEALPERAPAITTRMPIPADSRQHVADFLRRHRGVEVSDVVNINPMELAVYQLYVATDRAEHHVNQAGSWMRKTLVIDRPISQLPGRMEDGVIKISLPHAEHQFTFQGGSFQIQQGGGYVSVSSLGGGRLLLKAGYHRSFAFARAAMKEPEASDKCELVALTTSLPPELHPSFPHQGLRTKVLGSRAPLFSDFFDRDLAMAVKLRRKKYEAHLRIATLDDP
jgi:hypothetical protein